MNGVFGGDVFAENLSSNGPSVRQRVFRGGRLLQVKQFTVFPESPPGWLAALVKDCVPSGGVTEDPSFDGEVSCSGSGPSRLVGGVFAEPASCPARLASDVGENEDVG